MGDVRGSVWRSAISRIYSRLAITLLLLLDLLQRALCVLGAGLTWLANKVSPTSHWLLRWLLLPIYRLFFALRLRLAYAVSSARGFFFLLFTHRYVVHTTLSLFAIITIFLQWQASDVAAADVGKQSILYELVADQSEMIVEEDVTPADNRETTTRHYLGADTIQAVPDVDFDYEADVAADLSLPGSVAERSHVPGAEETNEPIIVQRNKTEFYTVQAGDTVAMIARQFGVNVGAIIWNNSLKNNGAIKPGAILKIPPVSGVLHIVKRGDTVQALAKKYQVEAERILTANALEASQKLAIGDELIVPDGVPPVTRQPTIVVRKNIPRNNVPGKSYDTYQEVAHVSTDVRLRPGNADTTRVPMSKLLWPTTQRSITQYYGWRHTGVDLDGDYTDAIYAAADGIVEASGWHSSGYGLQIVIDHEDGRRTRYAHSSKLFVRVGDRVKKGQVIAMVGTTGRSTGTHLHFEVYLNGRRQNPLAYIR